MSIRMRDNDLNQRRYQSLQTTKRKRLVLGRHVTSTIHGYQVGGLAYYEPSPSPQQYENTFISGPSGSGKTFVGYSLASQSYFAENRTWVIFDTKGSITGDSLVHVKINGMEKIVPISELIDPVIDAEGQMPGSGMTWIGHDVNASHLATPAPPGIETLSVCPDHVVRWKPITGFSRHDAPSKILKITTWSGREIVATANHSFIKLIDGKYVSLKGSDLELNDYLPVVKNGKRFNYDQGSSISYSEIAVKNKMHVVDVHHIIKDISNDRFPIARKINDDRLKNKDDGISREIARDLIKELEADYPEKTRSLSSMLEGDVWWDRIVSIEEVDGTGFVYDFQVDETENFMLANGIMTHNSAIGNWRPNVAFAEDVASYGMPVIGIPGQNIDIIAPYYFMETADIDSILRYKITDYYKIPLVMCGLELMFEIAKLRKKASYASTFQITFDKLLKQTNNRPSIAEFVEMIDDMLADPEFPTQLKWVYNMMKNKIDMVGEYIIDEGNRWSSLGKALLKAAQSGVPRWIVFTLVHAKHPQDDMNLALMTSVLTEIREFAQEARLNGYDINLGVMVDELHTYVNNKDATSTEAIHDLIFHWGRSQKLWRIYMTQKQEQLPKTFRDEIKGLKSRGTFQNIIECQAIPQPGYGQFLDRLHSRDENNPVDNNPRYYPAIQFMPPIIEVESDYSNDAEWKSAMVAKLSGQTIKKQTRQKPWEAVVASMMASNQTISQAARSLDQERATRTATSKRASSVPEVKDMWNSMIDSLNDHARN